ncbi:penicillin-binding protein 1C [Galbibacter pacificus]|uniref:peptidoglycan glycosyltransferase n=1 Tax=Galbibacter pacificus TaxID=2996052 RepID=A0ABT6FTT4_9FLAO|nr:penicillin-binding protein 1C [Galbibacter pacificus]MDG3583197.1 penicillin-binding protein 1C [Galbibacter pacificus]MDG3586678.1 penicillin-binding protein 1C [Galbibacter pacificus]
MRAFIKQLLSDIGKLLFVKHRIKSIAVIVLLVCYYFCLPKVLFTDSTSTVIESEDGQLLGARIADDEQWRFPISDTLPEKFKQCIIQFEDGYFYSHPGFNPASIAKALYANIKSGKIVRGGSTLTQQVIRLSREGKQRTYFEKFIELIQATRLEIKYTKDEILNLYAAHAPFGGNVVGLEVASWRYFGVAPSRLSWAESATLAVLPNAPSLIYPGKNKKRLLKKRNRLLEKLYQENIIDSLTFRLAITEVLPQKPYPLPQEAPHFLQFASSKYKGKKLRSSINYTLQKQVNNIVKRHYEVLKQNQVYNIGVLVLDIETRKVLAYVGNAPTTKRHQKDVDVIQAPRSTGSILKPFLYAAMLDSGELLPNTLVADIPTQIAGYSPKNYNEQYSGAVQAKKALAKSLNVPAVRLLQEYGLDKFREQLYAFKQKDIDKPADYYGLSLILGGAESNLWDLCKAYAGIASTVNHYTGTSSEYYSNEFIEPVFLQQGKADFGTLQMEKPIFDAGSFFLTLNALKEVNRPEGDEAWEFFDSSKEIAWKTGTSYGNRDAWAIGVTKKYAVGIWVGNADGEGRPLLTGINSAAPILFDVFDILPQTAWFTTPFDALTEVTVCQNSGFLASPICPAKKLQVPNFGTRFKVCPYHQLVHLDQQRQFRVNASCYPMEKMITEPWFKLPPLMEYYYKNTNANYKSLPPVKFGCQNNDENLLDFIYPKNHSKIVLTKNFKGKTNELICRIAHPKSNAIVFWYLDETYIGETKTFHEVAILPAPGKHTITVIDSFGNEKSISIEVDRT